MAISRKRCKTGGKLVLITNRKSYMRFRLVPKSVTLNDLERRNGRYFALFQRIFVYDVAVKQLLGLPRFQNLLLILYNHIKTICAIIQRLFGQNVLTTGFDGEREQIIDYVHTLGLPQIFIVEISKSVQWAQALASTCMSSSYKSSRSLSHLLMSSCFTSVIVVSSDRLGVIVPRC